MRQAWIDIEQKSAMEYFQEHIESNRLPGKHECLAFLKEANSKRSWTKVKDYVRNQIRKAGKKDELRP